MICAVILAAGESRRMGQPKLLLPLGDKTIIESVLENVIASKVDKILVVLGSNQKMMEKTIKNFPIEITINPRFSTGMLSSVICGFEALPAKTQGVLVVLGDQPSISSIIINDLISQYQKTKKGIIVPVYQGRRGHPILIDKKYKRKIHNLNSNIGLRELIHNHPEDILEVKIPHSTILQDIDTPDDYQKVQKKTP